MVATTFNLADVEYFLLVFARITSFMFVAPFYGQMGFPAATKIGTSFIISTIVVGFVAPEEAVYYSVIGYGVLVFKEVVCGLIIGYVANICQYILTYAGNIIDMDMGLSMASNFDQTLNTQVTMTGNIYFYFYMLLMLVTDAHTWLLKALIDTFKLFPLGGQNYQMDMLASGFISFMTNLFIIGFRIMLPIFAAMLILNIVLGIMAKVAPQMNMFSVGVQIKVIGGMVILFFMVFLFPQVYSMVYRQMQIIIRNMVGGMM